MFCRKALSFLLLALLVCESLPCTCRYEADGTGGGGRFSCRFEPLQVCDSDDAPLGGAADRLPPLAGPPVAAPLPGLSATLPEPDAAEHAGFAPPIDHPPEVPAQS